MQHEAFSLEATQGEQPGRWRLGLSPSEVHAQRQCKLDFYHGATVL